MKNVNTPVANKALYIKYLFLVVYLLYLIVVSLLKVIKFNPLFFKTKLIVYLPFQLAY